MPRAHTAVEAIDREIELLEKRLDRAKDVDERFQRRINEMNLVRRQNQALMADIDSRIEALTTARESLSPVDKPQEN